MKNRITGTSAEVTWPPTTQVRATSFSLSIQVQAGISSASCWQPANLQHLSKAARQVSALRCPTCPTCSAAGSLTFPKPRVWMLSKPCNSPEIRVSSDGTQGNGGHQELQAACPPWGSKSLSEQGKVTGAQVNAQDTFTPGGQQYERSWRGF